jgi:CRP/FNR family transcriptional regulator, cyclic AMP receptor protein
MTDQALVEALHKSCLGATLSAMQARTLAESLAFRDLSPGEILVKEGTSDNHLYVIVRGGLGVVKSAGTSEALTLFALTGGDLVGELGFIDQTPHYASLVAIGPTLVFGLEREKLEALLPHHPEIVYQVMCAIIRAVHQIQRRLSMQSVELSNYIYKQHGKY